MLRADEDNIPTSSLVPSRDTTANVSDTSGDTLALSSFCVLPVLVATIDDDVSLLEVRHETCKHAISNTAMRQAENEDLGESRESHNDL